MPTPHSAYFNYWARKSDPTLWDPSCDGPANEHASFCGHTQSIKENKREKRKKAKKKKERHDLTVFVLLSKFIKIKSNPSIVGPTLQPFRTALDHSPTAPQLKRAARPNLYILLFFFFYPSCFLWSISHPRKALLLLELDWLKVPTDIHCISRARVLTIKIKN